MANAAENPDATPRALARLLRDRTDALTARWIRRVLDDPSLPDADRAASPALRELVSSLHEQLVASLGAHPARSAVAVRMTYPQGCSVATALRELSHFRAALVELCDAEGFALRGDAALVLHDTIDRAMASAARGETGDDADAARRVLEEEAAFRERLLGIVGHDLRNPLSAILFSADLLLRREDLGEVPTRAVRRMLSSGQRMDRMVRDLLDFTRSRQGGIPLDVRPADLNQLCGRVIDELELSHPSRAVQFTPADDAQGEWDPDRLSQLVSNLVKNALDYSPPATPVRVTLREAGDRLALDVNNQGPAIPPSLLATLFDPFKRGAAIGKATRGLGLGTYIAKQIVEAHGGTIEVTSTPEAGTTFTVTLPRTPPAHRPPAERSEPR